MRWALVAAVLGGSAAAATADEGGVNVQSGETIFAQGTSLSVGSLVVRLGHRHEQWGILGVSYGVREDLTASLVVPWLSFREEAARDSGLADMSLLGKYRVFFDGGQGWEATVAVIGGLQVPTGATPGDLDPERRLGSGSWDPFAGAAATYEWNRFEVRTHALYQLNTPGEDDFKHEDIFTFGIGGTWRPFVQKYPGAELGFSGGLTYQRFFEARADGDRVRGSGGDLLYATVGAFWSPRAGIKLNVSVDLPVAQHREEELDYRAGAGGSYVF